MVKNEEKVVEKKDGKSKLKLDLDKIVNKVREGFGKDKSAAMKVSTGKEISHPGTDPENYVVWDKNEDGTPSPWVELTGCLGIPLGCFTQIAGRSNSGKSTHALQFMSKAIAQGFQVILVDSENKFAKDRFENYFGGDASQLLRSTSKFILEAGNHIERLIHAIFEENPKQKVLIIWDSIGGSLPKNESENSLDASKQMAAAAKENGAVLRAIVRLMDTYKDKENNKEKIACLLINQSYSNIGAPGQKEAGGNKVEYYSSLIVQLTRKADITKMVNKKKIKTAIKVRAKVSKNHLSVSENQVSELELIVNARGIQLATTVKKADDEEEDEILDIGE